MEPQGNNNWEEIINKAIRESPNYAQAIVEIQNEIKRKYSFTPESTNSNTTAYVYYGNIGKDFPMWRILDKLTSNPNNNSYYISSTSAGKLFNDSEFNKALKEAFKTVNIDEITNSNANNVTTPKVISGHINTGDDTIYEGLNNSGQMALNDGSYIKAFNDFFSKEYVEHIKSSDVLAIFAGNPTAKGGPSTLNCFGRTEFDIILKNDNIKTINGIDKNILKELRDKAPEGKKMLYVTDAIKTAQSKACSDIFFSIEKKDDKWSFKDIVNSGSDEAISLLDSIAENGKARNTTRLSDIINSNVLSDTAKEVLNGIINDDKKFLANYTPKKSLQSMIKEKEQPTNQSRRSHSAHF